MNLPLRFFLEGYQERRLEGQPTISRVFLIMKAPSPSLRQKSFEVREMFRRIHQFFHE